MIAEYKMPVSFGLNCFTLEGKPTASSLLHAFQEAATAHADEAHVGFDELISKGLIWVVTKIKYELTGEVVPNDELELVTYPIPVGSLIYQRDFYIYRGNAMLVRASSQWCIADYQTRRAVQTHVEFPGEYTEKRAFPQGIQRLRPKDLIAAGSRKIQQEDLDKNGHTNNCRYADMAQELIGGGFENFTINFAHETRLGDTILLSSGPGMAAGSLEGGKMVFAVSVS